MQSASEEPKLSLIRFEADTKIDQEAAKTVLQQTFSNKCVETLRDCFYTFPVNDGTVYHRIEKVICKFEEGWRVVRDPDSFSTGVPRIFRFPLGDFPAGGKISVEITFIDEIKDDAELRALRWTLPRSIVQTCAATPAPANPWATREYATMIIYVHVDLGDVDIDSLSSPSHHGRQPDGRWKFRMIQGPGLSLGKACATFQNTVPQLDKDLVLAIRTWEHERADNLWRCNTRCTTPHRTESRACGFGNQEKERKEERPNELYNHKRRRIEADKQAPAPPQNPTFATIGRTPVDIVLSLCNDSKHWDMHPNLPTLLSLPKEILETYIDPLKSRVWVTILVITWLEIKAPQERQKWLPYVTRAGKWLDVTKEVVKWNGLDANGGWEIDGWEVEAADMFCEDVEVKQEDDEEEGGEIWEEYDPAKYD